MSETVDVVTKAEAQVLYVRLGGVAALKCRHAIPPGSFTKALIEAIFLADAQNLEKLELGFPEHVAAAKKWWHENGFADYHIREAEDG